MSTLSENLTVGILIVVLSSFLSFIIILAIFVSKNVEKETPDAISAEPIVPSLIRDKTSRIGEDGNPESPNNVSVNALSFEF